MLLMPLDAARCLGCHGCLSILKMTLNAAGCLGGLGCHGCLSILKVTLDAAGCLLLHKLSFDAPRHLYGGSR